MPDTSIRIDTETPMPEFRHGSAKYPWHTVPVGRSFVVPGKRKSNMAAYTRAMSKKLSEKLGTSVVFRVDDDPEGCRVWRVK